MLAMLPLRVIQALGTVLGWITSVVPNRRLNTTRTNITLCYPKLSKTERRRLSRTSMVESAKGLLESGALWLWDNQRALDLVVDVSGEQALKTAYEQNHGVILALPHLGMWEIIGLYCSSRYPMTSLYRPPPIAGMDSLLQKGRQRFGAKLVPTDKTGVRALFKALGNGELVAILPDQEPASGGGEFAPFFGMQTNTMVLLSRLATKTGAAVLYAFAERLPAGKGYHIHFLPAEDNIRNPDIRISLAILNTGIEQCIRKLPQQYLWSYKRFRKRPDGESPIY